jgi:hypothetical protein
MPQLASACAVGELLLNLCRARKGGLPTISSMQIEQTGGCP